MYAIAIVGDLLSLIPFVNMVASPLTGLALGMAGSGTNLFSSSRIGGTLLTMGVEMIPGFSAFPTWTMRVYFAKKRDAADQVGQTA